jgi:hypothetical protein
MQPIRNFAIRQLLVDVGVGMVVRHFAMWAKSTALLSHRGGVVLHKYYHLPIAPF